MASLANVRPGESFVFVFRVTGVDPVNGISLDLYGPRNQKAATAVIAPDGSMAGNLADDPRQIQVTRVTGFTPVSVGDILENERTGETMIVRWTEINPGGQVLWSSSVATNAPRYNAKGWSVVGHIDIEPTTITPSVVSGVVSIPAASVIGNA